MLLHKNIYFLPIFLPLCSQFIYFKLYKALLRASCVTFLVAIFTIAHGLFITVTNVRQKHFTVGATSTWWKIYLDLIYSRMCVCVYRVRMACSPLIKLFIAMQCHHVCTGINNYYNPACLISAVAHGIFITPSRDRLNFTTTARDFHFCCKTFDM